MDILPLINPERIALGLALIAAGYERFRKDKRERKTQAEQDVVNDAKLFQERATILAKLAEDNAKLYETEHEEHKKTRLYWHAKANDFQATLSSCQDKLTEVQLRPDYTDLAKMIETQSETSTTILRAIQEVVGLLKTQIQHPTRPSLSHPKPL